MSSGANSNFNNISDVREENMGSQRSIALNSNPSQQNVG